MKSSLTSFLLLVVFLLFFCAVQLVQFELDKHYISAFKDRYLTMCYTK